MKGEKPLHDIIFFALRISLIQFLNFLLRVVKI